MANLNFSEIPSREPLAEGVYILNIEAAEEKQSSTGKDMILVRFKEPETNTAIFENYVLTLNCLWKLQELCDALGIDTSVNFDSTELIPMLVGNQVKAKVVQDTYNEQTVNRIKKVYAC